MLAIYFVLSGVTWVAGTPGQGILGRVALPDLFFLLVIVYIVAAYGSVLRLSPLGRAAMVMLVAFFVGIPFSSQPGRSAVEWVVHLYAVVLFLILYTVASRAPLEGRIDLLVWWVRAGVVLTLIGTYDLFAMTVGLPGIAVSLGNAPRAGGGIVGTFRNTGQAGAFLVTVLAVAIPLQRIVTGRRRIEIAMAIAILATGLALSFKRAAILGFAAGVLLFVLRDLIRKGGLVRSVLAAALIGALLVPAFSWFSGNSEQVRWRMTAKFSASGAAVAERFMESNVDAAREAISENAVFGAGIGAVSTADGFEIHSTYLSVIASTGMVGALAYGWMMIVFLRSCSRSRNRDPRAQRFGRLFLPLVIGLLVSYAYTYHLRKREFWITAALVSGFLAPVPARREILYNAEEPGEPWATRSMR